MLSNKTFINQTQTKNISSFYIIHKTYLKLLYNVSFNVVELLKTGFKTLLEYYFRNRLENMCFKNME